MQTLTAQHDAAEHRVVSLQRAAIPAMMSELVLAFPDPLFGSLSNGLHEVWVSLAQLSLLVYQTWNVVTYDPSAQRTNIPVNTFIDLTHFLMQHPATQCIADHIWRSSIV